MSTVGSGFRVSIPEVRVEGRPEVCARHTWGGSTEPSRELKGDDDSELHRTRIPCGEGICLKPSGIPIARGCDEPGVSGLEYGAAVTWYLYTAVLVAAIAATYLMFLRSYRRMYSRASTAPSPSIRYYYVSVRSREGEELLEHANRLLNDGDYVRATKEARDAVAKVIAEVCRRMGAGCEGEPPEKAARTLSNRGYYMWPQGVRELEELARRRSVKKGDAARAVEIALRVMAAAREIRVEPPRKAVAGQEGNKVPGSS